MRVRIDSDIETGHITLRIDDQGLMSTDEGMTVLTLNGHIRLTVVKVSEIEIRYARIFY